MAKLYQRFSDKPDVQSIHQDFEHLRTLWAQAHAKFRRIDQFYWNTFNLWPDGLKRPESHPATPTRIIDHAVDTQLAYNPVVHRDSVGLTQADEEDADAVEPFISAALAEASLLEMELPFKTAGKYMLLYGYAVLEGPVLDMSRYPDLTLDSAERRQLLVGWNPFRIRAPHPASVMCDPQEKIPPLAIKWAFRYAGDIAQLAKQRERNFASSRNYYERIETYEYWTEKWHALVAKNELVFVERNTWGFVPFTHSFSGFGSETTLIQQNDPVYRAVGLLDPVMDSLKRHAQEVTARHNMLLNASFPPMGTKKSAEDIAQQLARGEILDDLNPDDVWWMQFPQVQNWMMQSGSDTLRDIEEGTYSGSLAGFHEQGVRTVGQQAILSTAANRKFKVTNAQLQYMVTVIARNMLQLVDKLDETLTISGYKLSPSQIKHNYNVQVEFELIDPVLQQQERQMAIQEYQLGLISAETYRANAARIEDETGERKRLLKDEILKNPIVHSFLTEQVMKEEGLDELASNLKDQRQQYLSQLALQNTQPQMMEEQSAGGNGAPPQLGNPMQAEEPGAMGVPTANPPTPGSPRERQLTLRRVRKSLTGDVAKPQARRR